MVWIPKSRLLSGLYGSVYDHEVNIQEQSEFFGWDTANESTWFRKHIKQKTRDVVWSCVSMAKLSNPV